MPDDLDGAVDAEYDALFAELSRLCRPSGPVDPPTTSRRTCSWRVAPSWTSCAIGRASGRGSGRSPSDASAGSGPRPGDRWPDEPVFLPVDPDLGLDAAAAIAHLPDRERIAVVLVYGLGYRQEEAAVMLGITRGGLASSLWQARRKLARELAPYRRQVGP